jgi:hypothetical protein
MLVLLCANLPLFAMEQKVETEKKVERKQPEFRIDPEIQEKLDEINKNKLEALRQFESPEQKGAYEVARSFELQKVGLVLHCGSKMSNAAKLEYITDERIVKEMIEKEGIHPDDIGTNPLRSATYYREFEFSKYLLDKGADPMNALQELKEEEASERRQEEEGVTPSKESLRTKKMLELLELYAKKLYEQKG